MDQKSQLAQMLSKLWENRPWQGHAQNPPSMAPQLAIALGLMGPRVGATTSLRDLNMARDLRGAGEAPAAMQGLPQGMPAPPQAAAPRAHPEFVDVPGNQNGNFGAPGRIGGAEKMRAFESYVDALPPHIDPVAYQTFLRMQGANR